MPMSAIRLVSVIAGNAGFGQPPANKVRTLIGKRIVNWTSAADASLVVFPAGYLRAGGSGPGSALATAGNLVSAARSLNVAILLGVDVGAQKKAGGKSQVGVRALKGQLPFFAVAWAPGMVAPVLWRQRSTTSSNWRGVAHGEWEPPREITVRGKRIAVALCGEAFSQPLRTALLERRPRLSVVLIPAHTAKGSRHSNALKYFGERDLAAVRAVHAQNRADNYLWVGGKKRAPVKRGAFGSRDELWAEASVFHL